MVNTTSSNRWRIEPSELSSGSKRGLADLLLTGIVTAIGAVFAFAANVIIARSVGVSSYGIYMTIVSAAMVLGAVATYGMGPLITREIAARGSGSWGEALNAIGASELRLTIGLALCGSIAVLAWLTLVPTAPSSTWPVRIAGALVVPSYAGALLTASVLAGMHRVSASQMVASVLRNGVLLGGGTLLLYTRLADVLAITWLQVVAMVVALAVGIYWCRCGLAAANNRPSLRVMLASRMSAVDKSWRKEARHFFVISLATLVLFRLDVVLVNTVAGSDQAGLFGAAARIGQLTQLVGLVWLAWLRPRMARTAAGGQREYESQLVRWGIAGSGLMTVVPVVVGWVFASDLLSLMGPGFAQAVWPLRWLLLSWLPWAIAVPAYALLSMSGRERELAYALWFQVLLVVGTGPPLIAVAGATGGAIAWMGSSLVAAGIIVTLGARAR